jgi:hypothetical protein
MIHVRTMRLWLWWHLTGFKWTIVHRWRWIWHCRPCGGSGIEEIYGGYGTVLERPCDYCGGSGRWL